MASFLEYLQTSFGPCSVMFVLFPYGHTQAVVFGITQANSTLVSLGLHGVLSYGGSSTSTKLLIKVRYFLLPGMLLICMLMTLTHQSMAKLQRKSPYWWQCHKRWVFFCAWMLSKLLPLKPEKLSSSGKVSVTELKNWYTLSSALLPWLLFLLVCAIWVTLTFPEQLKIGLSDMLLPSTSDADSTPFAYSSIHHNPDVGLIKSPVMANCFPH